MYHWVQSTEGGCLSSIRLLDRAASQVVRENEVLNRRKDFGFLTRSILDPDLMEIVYIPLDNLPLESLFFNQYVIP